MLPNILLFLTAALLGTASASAVPSAYAATYAILAARGIDPHGPIPLDAVPIPGTDGTGYTFEADSDTSHWVRTQHLSPKRALSGLSITMWSFTGCQGGGAYFGNVQYMQNSVSSSHNFYNAIDLQPRALLSSEKIDFSASMSANPDPCGTYLFSSPKGMGAGCRSLPGYSCFRLLRK